MSKRRALAKVDANQAEIKRACKSIGASVTSIHEVGDGCPDLLVGFRGVNFLVEVKGEDGKLSDDEVIWHESWMGTVYIVRTGDQMIKVLEDGTT